MSKVFEKVVRKHGGYLLLDCKAGFQKHHVSLRMSENWENVEDKNEAVDLPRFLILQVIT